VSLLLTIVLVLMAVAFVGALIMLRRAHANGSADVLRDNVKTQR
jgi:hypothetical protein